jgi:hypothetical protein
VIDGCVARYGWCGVVTVPAHLAAVNLDNGAVGRASFESGWRVWSKNVEPIAGTDSCQAAHTRHVISG